MSTYTVYAGQLDEVKKRLEKMRKKAETYGASFSYSVGEEYPATVSVNSIDPVSSTIYVSARHPRQRNGMDAGRMGEPEGVQDVRCD